MLKSQKINPSVLNFTFPNGWHDLSQKQLKFLFKLFAKEYSLEFIKIVSLFRWNKVRVLARKGDGSYILGAKNYKNSIFIVSPLQIAEIFPFLSWIEKMPDYPVCIKSLGYRKALPADFQGVPFEKFIMADNLYQGYLATKNDQILDQLASVLYPSVFPQGALSPWERVAVFYWFNSLKNFLSIKFNEFFRPANSENNILNDNDDFIEEAMNAQIRALTKGDVTKEKEILALDTWRALTELNAQAREFREFNAKYNKK